jgi:ribosomal protein L7Ae-like RNA K-turn-binding protein
LRDKLLGYLGLAKKAGKVALGSGAAEGAIRSAAAAVVIVAKDASENTVKRISDKCKFYQVGLMVYGTKEQIGRALGAGDTACAAVTDGQLAKAMIQCFEEINGGVNIW